MTIINMAAITYQTLMSVPDIKAVTTNYPDTFAVYPTAVYQTSHTSAFVDSDMQEIQTDWTITIDLFTNYGSLTALTNKLISLFGAMGFLNTTGTQDLNGANRTVIRFTGTVDNSQFRVYQKG
ncbi:hypothetical protein DLJ48_06870 [Oenococcus sicerae]|uniref:Prophage protein n=1 Tax=Oenococcus sicerae TaxID=2203724 RepID=A0ABX5QNA7_9LACO|nr:hypothetical protein [Oenococcus sicerae]QAS70262.1 hypothetical protein DLJ48_06870 [Oenococcus sicerae]